MKTPPRIIDLAHDENELRALTATSQEIFAEELTRMATSFRRKALSLLNPEIADGLKGSSKLESLVLYDENDRPYRRPDGTWAVEFRKDFRGTTTYADGHGLKDLALRDGRIEEVAPHCRVVFFVVERENGNVLFARRGKSDSDSGRMELSGGHVADGGGYLNTASKEVFEEFGLRPVKNAVDFADSVSKFSAWIPDDADNGYAYGKQRGIHGVVFRVIVANDAVPHEKREVRDPLELAPETLLSWLDERIDGLAAGGKTPESLDIAVHHVFGFLKYLERRGFDVAGRLASLSRCHGYNVTREFPA